MHCLRAWIGTCPQNMIAESSEHMHCRWIWPEAPIIMTSLTGATVEACRSSKFAPPPTEATNDMSCVPSGGGLHEYCCHGVPSSALSFFRSNDGPILLAAVVCRLHILQHTSPDLSMLVSTKTVMQPCLLAGYRRSHLQACQQTSSACRTLPAYWQ